MGNLPEYCSTVNPHLPEFFRVSRKLAAELGHPSLILAAIFCKLEQVEHQDGQKCWKFFAHKKWLAEACCLKRNAVYRFLQVLVAHGWLRKPQREGRRASTYQLTHKARHLFEDFQSGEPPRFIELRREHLEASSSWPRRILPAEWERLDRVDQHTEGNGIEPHTCREVRTIAQDLRIDPRTVQAVLPQAETFWSCSWRWWQQQVASWSGQNGYIKPKAGQNGYITRGKTDARRGKTDAPTESDQVLIKPRRESDRPAAAGRERQTPLLNLPKDISPNGEPHPLMAAMINAAVALRPSTNKCMETVAKLALLQHSGQLPEGLYQDILARAPSATNPGSKAFWMVVEYYAVAHGIDEDAAKIEAAGLLGRVVLPTYKGGKMVDELFPAMVNVAEIRRREAAQQRQLAREVPKLKLRKPEVA